MIPKAGQYDGEETQEVPQPTEADTHRLVLLRHAKSSWGDPGLDDRERPLNARGRQAGKLLAAHFAKMQRPDLVLCSSALRTRQTLDLVAHAWAPPAPAAIEDGLYLASAPALLARLTAVQDEVGTVLVLAHNPGLHHLAEALAAHSSRALRGRLAEKFPTGATATFRFTGPWAGIAHTTIILTDLTIPADLSSDLASDLASED
jgi:phosphohistidine phosphatase